MWIPLALLSAVFAGAVAILGKLGLKDVDSTLATALRSVVMAVFLLTTTAALGKFQGFSLGDLGSKGLLFIVLAGIAGALSWICYFAALRLGPATSVAVFDRLSVVFVLILAALFLNEPFTAKSVGAVFLMLSGAVLLVWK